MKYQIEDTHNGYRLTMLDNAGNPRHHYDELGGHGPLERLYADAADLWVNLRGSRTSQLREDEDNPVVGAHDVTQREVESWAGEPEPDAS